MSEGHGVPARTKYERGELKGASSIAFDFCKSPTCVSFCPMLRGFASAAMHSCGRIALAAKFQILASCTVALRTRAGKALTGR